MINLSKPMISSMCDVNIAGIAISVLKLNAFTSTCDLQVTDPEQVGQCHQSLNSSKTWRSRSLILELVQATHEMHLWHKFGRSSYKRSQVIVMTSNCDLVRKFDLNVSDLEMRSRSLIFELVQAPHEMHPWHTFHRSSYKCSQVIVVTSNCDPERKFDLNVSDL